eukprot:m.205788 g.205788  ORF g.205788 m.205788 type:complete len:566 (+) comp18882_c0_seq1:205-1902(+)
MRFLLQPTFSCTTSILIVQLLLNLTNGENADTTGTFLLLTDIHYDPYFGTPQGFVCTQPLALPRFGCDSPLRLVQHSISEAARLHPNPDFILVAGDSVRHDGHAMPNPEQDIGTIIDVVLNLTDSYFPAAQTTHGSPADPHLRLVSTFGNNDVFEDYVLPVTSAAQNNSYLSFLAQHWSPHLSTEELADAVRGGFYERQVADGLVVLSINTVVYSVYHCNYGPPQVCTSPDEGDPFGQFAWLEAKLRAARLNATKVYILGHIPPIVGSFSHNPMWKASFVESFLSIVSTYDDVIMTMLFGHVHSDEFRTAAASKSDLTVPILMSSAITPIYDNNPSFKVFRYDKNTKALLDSTMYSAPLSDVYGSWKALVNSSTNLGFPNLTGSSICTHTERIVQNDSLWNEFYNTAYKAGVLQPSCNVTSSCRRTWKCLLGSIKQTDFNACQDSTDRSTPSSTATTTLTTPPLLRTSSASDTTTTPTPSLPSTTTSTATNSWRKRANIWGILSLVGLAIIVAVAFRYFRGRHHAGARYASLQTIQVEHCDPESAVEMEDFGQTAVEFEEHSIIG